MDDKPVFRIGAAGLDPRDLRLIEIVFKHIRYNRYAYRLVEDPVGEPVDILIANPADPRGPQAVAIVRRSGRSVPVIAAVPRGVTSSARHAISIERLTLQLLPILNRVVELDLRAHERASGAASSATAGQATPSATAQRVTSHPATHETPASAAIPTASIPAAAIPAAPVPAAPIPAAAAASTPTASTPTASTAPASAPPDRPASGRPTAAHPAPAAPAAQRPPAPARSNLLPFPVQNPGEGLIAQRLKVLVVDDSPTVRRQLSVAFDRLGLACEPVASAADALDRLAGEHFDLALVDVVMPEIDGYKLTREIKRNKHLKQMPVIILTSRSSPFDLARGALAGCDTYLTKPVPFRALEAAVVRLLRKSLAIDDLTGLIRTSMPDAARGAQASAKPPEEPASRLARLESRVARLFKR